MDAVDRQLEGVVCVEGKVLSILGMSSASSGQSSVMAGLQLASISLTLSYRSIRKSKPKTSKLCRLVRSLLAPSAAFIDIPTILFMSARMSSYA